MSRKKLEHPTETKEALDAMISERLYQARKLEGEAEKVRDEITHLSRIRTALFGILALALAGCVHPQPVNPSSAPAAWFVVDDQVWYCDKAQVPLCRCFRGNER